jgi:DNA-binding transcriptional LysR family regulator
VSVTEAGRVYLERCLECLQAYDDSEAALGGLTAEPRGLLRVAAPFDLNRHLRELITQFMKAHPAIDLDLRLSNRTLDMVDEGIDVYLRITNTIDAGLIARPLAVTTMGLFGARSYFQKHRRPRTPSDLAEHRFALFNEPPVLDEWTFERRGKRAKVRLRPAIVANSGELAMAAVNSGIAMGVIPSFLLPPEHAHLLEPVMLEWSIGQRGIYAVYPHRRFVPSKVRAFVDFCRSTLGDGRSDPWWPPSIPPPGLERGPVQRIGSSRQVPRRGGA